MWCSRFFNWVLYAMVHHPSLRHSHSISFLITLNPFKSRTYTVNKEIIKNNPSICCQNFTNWQFIIITEVRTITFLFQSKYPSPTSTICCFPIRKLKICFRVQINMKILFWCENLCITFLSSWQEGFLFWENLTSCYRFDKGSRNF